MRKAWVSIVVLALLPALCFAQFRLKMDVKLVEVYVSVTDGKGKPIQGLQSTDFRVLEDGREQQIHAFETSTSSMTLALLIDTTGSVANELPHVKNAISRLLSSLGPEDSVGIFTFATNLTPLSAFGTDRRATLGALLQTRAGGQTALFDSLVQLSREVSRIGGKKAILLFTDGDDNSSVVSLESSMRETQRVGVPIYAMLYGRALEDSRLLKRIEEIAKSTGGSAFRVRQSDDLPAVFERIGEDMQDLYYLGYHSNSESKAEWHALKVNVPGQPKLNIKAKDGYWQ